MTYTHYIHRGFPGVLTEMIAEASMELPPLTHPTDAAFLRTVLVLCTSAFWENYISTCTAKAQEEWSNITEAEDESAAVTWTRTYADFVNDADAFSRADMVLEDLGMRLPELMKEAYSELPHEAV
jgi:hypothetical protein